MPSAMIVSVPPGRCGPCCSMAATGSTAIVRSASMPLKSLLVSSHQNRRFIVARSTLECRHRRGDFGNESHALFVGGNVHVVKRMIAHRRPFSDKRWHIAVNDLTRRVAHVKGIRPWTPIGHDACHLCNVVEDR